MDGSDSEIARRITTGAPDARAAEAELARMFGPRIRTYGLRHLGNAAAADDLVQQVLVVVIDALRTGKVREPDRLASYVLGTCRLTAQGLRRGERRREQLLDHYGLRDEVVDPVMPLDVERLRRCLEHLPPREQTIVVLTYYVEQSGDEIATELAMSAGNVRVVRHRALGHLLECMGGVP